jgi:hypothetical protein
LRRTPVRTESHCPQPSQRCGLLLSPFACRRSVVVASSPCSSWSSSGCLPSRSAKSSIHSSGSCSRWRRWVGVSSPIGVIAHSHQPRIRSPRPGPDVGSSPMTGTVVWVGSAARLRRLTCTRSLACSRSCWLRLCWPRASAQASFHSSAKYPDAPTRAGAGPWPASYFACLAFQRGESRPFLAYSMSSRCSVTIFVVTRPEIRRIQRSSTCYQPDSIWVLARSPISTALSAPMPNTAGRLAMNPTTKIGRR